MHSYLLKSDEIRLNTRRASGINGERRKYENFCYYFLQIKIFISIKLFFSWKVSFPIDIFFTNLINNSLKFSDPSRLSTIKIALEKNAFKLPPAVDLSLTDYHIIKYTDNGVGFEPEDNEKIFKIFTRLYNSQSIVGSGIGLAICRKIMQTHNGYIFAEGKPNKGATFRILFPKKLMEIKK